MSQFWKRPDPSVEVVKRTHLTASQPPHSSSTGADSGDATFTPALGRPELTGLYDLAIRVLTRERLWRNCLLRQLAPKNGETILDVGCGTGTFAIMVKAAAPRARVIGLDPDPSVLELAAEKAAKANAPIELRQGFACDAPRVDGFVDKVVSSLVFHQVPLVDKARSVAALFDAVRLGGEVHIADYAYQPTSLMRALFRLTVQMADGVEDTQPNADGALEAILAELMDPTMRAAVVVPTATGAISLFKALAPKTEGESTKRVQAT